MHNRNSSGPKIVPWGTPQFNEQLLESDTLMEYDSLNMTEIIGARCHTSGNFSISKIYLRLSMKECVAAVVNGHEQGFRLSTSCSHDKET